MESQFADIFHWVKRATGVDFPQYKPSTLRRRILRRMVLHKMETVGSYLKRLENDPSELDALYRDLLISVTSFFRDPETFEYLKSDVIPHVLKRPPRRFAHSRVGARMRHGRGSVFHRDSCCWSRLQSPGGSTPIQIFASDISKQAIQIGARRPLSGEYCRRCFSRAPAEIFRQNQ